MIPSRQLAQAELVRVVAHLLEAKTAAQRFKVLIIGVRQRLVHVDLPAAQIHRRVLGHNAFAQGGQGNGNLDRGAGLARRWRARASG